MSAHSPINIVGRRSLEIEILENDKLPTSTFLRDESKQTT